MKIGNRYYYDHPEIGLVEVSKEVHLKLQNKMPNKIPPPLPGELAIVTLPVKVVFEWSDKILVDCDVDEQGNESNHVYKSGFIMKVLPNQSCVWREGDQRVTIAFTMEEK